MMEKLEKFLNKFWWLILLPLSVPAVWALFVPGFYGASDDLHVGWLYEMGRSLALGQIPPRFIPDLSFQFGYPLFDFVFPLPFYIGEIIHLAGFSLVDSIKGVFLVSIPLSMYGMYILLRKFSVSLWAIIGALIYGYSPYRSSDIYVRGDIGEALSFVFFPLLVYSFIQIALGEHKRKNLLWVGIGGFSLGFLILSHDIASYMFFPATLLLGVLLVCFISGKKVTAALSLLSSMGLGLLISIYFWLPALQESTLVKYSTVFNFADHFPYLKQLLIPFFGWGASVPGPNDGLSFYIGTINLFVLFTGILILIFKWRSVPKLHKVFLSWGVVIFTVSFFMMNNRSIPLWEHIPLLPYFQFPWRFLMLTTFITPLFVIVLQDLKVINPSIQKITEIVLIGLVIVFNWYYFRPHDFLGREDSYYINRYIPYPTPSNAYLQTSEEYLRLPLANEGRPTMVYPRVYPTEGITQIRIQNDLDATIQTVSQNEFTLNYNKYFFPGWMATLDGQSWPLYSGKPLGQISTKVSPGDHTLNIFYEETSFKKVLDLISLASFIMTLVFVVVFNLKIINSRVFNIRRKKG